MTNSIGLLDDEDVQTVLFSRDQSQLPIINLFSVPTPHRAMSLQNRHVVRYEGQDDGDGKWVCSKDKETRCVHVAKAQHVLQQLILEDPLARHSDTGFDPGKCSLTSDLRNG